MLAKATGLQKGPAHLDTTAWEAQEAAPSLHVGAGVDRMDQEDPLPQLTLAIPEQEKREGQPQGPASRPSPTV